MDVEKDIEKIKQGFYGEKIVRDFLNKKPNCIYGQLDMIAKIDNDWYSIEVKHQEMFKSPPFDGHGLPTWQVEMRLKLYNEKGIIPLLFILDKTTNILMYNSLINLEKGDKYITKKKNRVIYPIKNFTKLSEVT